MSRPLVYAMALLSAPALTGLGEEPPWISSTTIDGGGVMYSSSADDRFILSGTIGQPDPGEMFGEDVANDRGFALTGGFWFGVWPGDCNANGILDLGDHTVFAECTVTTADTGLTTGCRCADIDNSQTIDLRDYAENQRSFGGG